MRTIVKIIVHCTATPAGREVSINEIERWHKARGFRKIGYHFVIALDGTVNKGREVSEVGAHCKGHNATSIGVCYVGGVDKENKPKDTRTPEQKTALVNLLNKLCKQYSKAAVHGHYEFSNKACPSFDVNELRQFLKV